jgi:uncharacterized protein
MNSVEIKSDIHLVRGLGIMAAGFELFALPFNDRYVLYDPLHTFSALAGSDVVNTLRLLFAGEKVEPKEELRHLMRILSQPGAQPVMVQSGDLTHPMFLGLITTRGCNMSCKYCDFAAPKIGQPVMDLSLARGCVDAYFNLLAATEAKVAEIQFFGGEPFFGNHVAEFILPYARDLAQRTNIDVHFTVTTNGLFSPQRARWIAANFDAIILSFDGQAAVQNLLRPTAGGQESFEIVNRSAEILSAGTGELTIRSCITDATVSNLPAVAQWIGEHFNCTSVCFEALTPSELSDRNNIQPPDPVQFAQSVLQAGEVLDAYGIDTITSGTDLNVLQESFCPVGKDALIVTPDGQVNACYLLEKDWRAQGFDLGYGRFAQQSDIPAFEIYRTALDSVRSLARRKSPLCADCFCKYHCAGGCRVNHPASQYTQGYDNVCLQTRAIVAGKLFDHTCVEKDYRFWRDDPQKISATISGAVRVGTLA